MRFGEILAQCRKQRGLNQAELAEKLTALGCEVSNQAVSKWEKDMTLPSARQFLTLCDVLEIEKDIEERDYRDMHRKTAPLVQADDAVLVDTSDMTKDEVVRRILSLVHKNEAEPGDPA